MSWNDSFPILSDELVNEFRSHSTLAERSALAEYFAHELLLNPAKNKIVLNVSLFWKNVARIDDTATSAPLSLEVLKNARANGLVERYDPWHHYVHPILHGAKRIFEENNGVGVRVFLAKDLEFLAEELSRYCEVRVMKSSSISAMPGMLWRFLGMEIPNETAVIVDGDQLMGWRWRGR